MKVLDDLQETLSTITYRYGNFKIFKENKINFKGVREEDKIELLNRLFKEEKNEAKFERGEILSEPSDEVFTAVGKLTSSEKDALQELFRLSSK